MEITIKNGELKDIEACHLIDKEDDFFDYGTWDETFKRAVERNQLIVAEIDGQIVGYLRYGFIWDLELPFVEMMRVLPNKRKLGIGRKLMEALIHVAKANEFTELISSTGANNKDSQSFHKKIGFKEIGKLPLIKDDHEEIFFRYDF